MDIKNIKSRCLCTNCILDRNKTILWELFPDGGDLTIEINMFDCYIFQICVNQKLTLMDIIEKLSGVEFHLGSCHITGSSSVLHQTELSAYHGVDNVNTCIKNISEGFFFGTQREIPTIYLEEMEVPQSGPTAARPKNTY